jgi:antagonist of KipI
MIRVLSPGMQTTVQDLGRPGYAHLGVSASGAADAFSLRAANLLVGNREGAAALEMTLVGGAFEFQAETVAALAGSDFGAGVPLWTPLTFRAGDVLRCGPTRAGARCYLAVRGGIDVPLVMGSASTHLVSGLGGLEGRALRTGDVLRTGDAAVRPPARNGLRLRAGGSTIRAVPGPQAEWFGEEFWRTPYKVTEESNRMGIRLAGPALERHAGQMLTEGVPLGAVQVPPNGQPIILFVEHQTTGGYPKIASVIAADLKVVGQLRPRDAACFERVSMEHALELLREQEQWLARIGGGDDR